MVTSTDYRHVPISRLAILAQRLGKVFASTSTWYRLVRERGWRRPRLRVHPKSPKVGLRTSRPNEAWHVDVTLIRLLDGTKLYLHGVVDTRRSLARPPPRAPNGRPAPVQTRPQRAQTAPRLKHSRGSLPPLQPLARVSAR